MAGQDPTSAMAAPPRRHSSARGRLKWVPAFAGMTILGSALAGSLSPASAQPDRPGRWLSDARGRIHVHTAHLAQVRNWRDRGDCTSTFQLVRPGAQTIEWRLDWKRVRNVQISTRKYFNTDVEETAYHQQPGLILYGRKTTSGVLPDRTRTEHDNVEFFLKDVTQMDYAFRGLKAYAQACRR